MILPTAALEITHNYIEKVLQKGDVAIDATMGNGNDTLFMANLVGDTGKVYSFDIQEQAISKTKELLCQKGMEDRAILIKDGHQNMCTYAKYPVKAVMFNLGYLPGGNHNIATTSNTTIAAIESAMELICRGGIITIGIYYGGDSGFEEKDCVLEYLKTIDFKKFVVICHDYVNRPNCPPITVIIEKILL